MKVVARDGRTRAGGCEREVVGGRGRSDTEDWPQLCTPTPSLRRRPSSACDAPPRSGRSPRGWWSSGPRRRRSCSLRPNAADCWQRFGDPLVVAQGQALPPWDRQAYGVLGALSLMWRSLTAHAWLLSSYDARAWLDSAPVLRFALITLVATLKRHMPVA